MLVSSPSTGRTWLRPGRSDGSLGPRIGGWSGWANLSATVLTDDVSGDGVADAVVRSSTGKLRARPGRGRAWARVAALADDRFASARSAQVVGDWDGDGLGDVIAVRHRRLWLHRGTSTGLASRTGGWAGWRHRDPVTAVGDWTGDDRPDLLARRASGSLWLYPGAGSAGVGAGHLVVSSVGAADLLVDGGRWNDDAWPDVLARRSSGELVLWSGTRSGTLASSRTIATDLGRYDRITGVGDWTRDGHPDLLAHAAATGRLHLLPGAPTGLGRRVVLPLEPLAADNLS